MTWQVFILAAFATYRVSRMLAQEDGPFDALTRVRARAGQQTWIGRGLHCIWCLSFWVALAVACGLAAQGSILWRDLWLVWLGLAGGGIAIYQVVR